ncbi:MAG TPA: phosphoketolase family protein, partial [Acidobacteriaceae bacterium]|nr:phosphoketolase family protein [Acidobacteriaceae bacterium]
DGVVLPVLHLNGYKIANPTIMGRMPQQELEWLFRGYGWTPHFVDGDDPQAMNPLMAATLERCIEEIRTIQREAREEGKLTGGTQGYPRWPMIVLRTPKGWTGPKEVDGHKVEGFWRAHQVPILEVAENPQHLRLLENWLRSYKPEELFDIEGRPVQELLDLAPEGERRMTANPHANGGKLRKPLRMPDFRDYALKVEPGKEYAGSAEVLAHFLRDVMRNNPTNFRVFGPDETASNRLQAIYQASPKTWMEEIIPEDADGTEIAPDGRVMEMLSEHTLEGWFEGYVLTGRHGFFSTYEAFVHVIDSMFNQHAKWLEKSKTELRWRASVSSINLLITSVVWRQDHNGFSHQDPGFLDVVANKSAEVTRIYLPPDANCLLSVADHCLRSQDYVNVIVADKQPHLQFLNMEQAIDHCTKGIGIWDWASTDEGKEPDVVLACAGDIATMETLAATAILRERFPDLKIRFVNVVDLFRLQPESEHPHGLTDRDFDSLFTKDKPVIFNFHGYPLLIHRLTYRRTNHDNIHVRGYKEKGNINTPLELAIVNNVSRFNVAIDVINRVPRLRDVGSHTQEWLRDQITDSINYAHTNGIDREEIRNWTWPL